MKENETTELFEIIWLDELSQEVLLQNDNYSQIILSLKEYQISFFDKANQCKDYLCQLRTDVKGILVVNEQLSEILVNNVHNLCPIKFIFIIRSNKEQVTDRNNIYSQFIKVTMHVYRC